MIPIERIELPTGLSVGSVNAYLFAQPEVVLVDAGIKSDECWDALVNGLAGHGIAPRDIMRVVITHAHVDHYGLAARITRESDATVWISDLGAPWLTADGNKWAERLAYYRDHFLSHLGFPDETVRFTLAGMEALAKLAEPVPEDRLVTFRVDGMLQMGGAAWQVLHTPGHAGMQTCFSQPQTGQLLSADMLLAIAPTPVVEQPPDGTTNRVPALPQFLQSLDLLDTREIGQVYPGHGRPFAEHRTVIARQRERISQRKLECLALVRAGQSTVPELLDSMYAHQPPAGRMAGLWMLVGYLDLLIAEDLVVQETVDNTWCYRPIL